MAHGHAITSTETVLARAMETECVVTIHTTNVITESSENHRHEDGTGAIGQPLCWRPRRLGLLHHASNLSEHRIFAQGLCAAYNRAIVVKRPGQYTLSGLSRQRGRLAGQHGLIHAGAALNDLCVHRKSFAGKYQHFVADSNFLKRYKGFDAIHNAASGSRPQLG